MAFWWFGVIPDGLQQVDWASCLEVGLDMYIFRGGWNDEG